jgi:hypothetical protein
MLNNLFESLHRDGYIIIRNAIKLDSDIEDQFDFITENLTQQNLKKRKISDKFTGVPSPLERSLDMSNQIMNCGGIYNIIETNYNCDNASACKSRHSKSPRPPRVFR